jgi:hypothetical protein
MSTQLWGYSVGGLAQRCLVEPASMIWPKYALRLEFHARALTRGSNLVLCALFNTLHSSAYTGAGAGHGMRRERLFALAFVGAGVWGACALVRTQCGVMLTAEGLALFPSYLFSALRCAGWRSCA